MYILVWIHPKWDERFSPVDSFQITMFYVSIHRHANFLFHKKFCIVKLWALLESSILFFFTSKQTPSHGTVGDNKTYSQHSSTWLHIPLLTSFIIIIFSVNQWKCTCASTFYLLLHSPFYLLPSNFHPPPSTFYPSFPFPIFSSSSFLLITSLSTATLEYV